MATAARSAPTTKRWRIKIAKLRDHGRTSKYEHDEIGYGERLDSLQAAILGAKLPHLYGWNDARRRHAEYYDQALAGHRGHFDAEGDGGRTPHLPHLLHSGGQAIGMPSWRN